MPYPFRPMGFAAIFGPQGPGSGENAFYILVLRLSRVLLRAQTGYIYTCERYDEVSGLRIKHSLRQSGWASDSSGHRHVRELTLGSPTGIGK